MRFFLLVSLGVDFSIVGNDTVIIQHQTETTKSCSSSSQCENGGVCNGGFCTKCKVFGSPCQNSTECCNSKPCEYGVCGGEQALIMDLLIVVLVLVCVEFFLVDGMFTEGIYSGGVWTNGFDIVAL